MCLITANDSHLDKCLASFADFVQEICIVINDPRDANSIAIAKKYGAKYEVCLDFNDSEGRIKDFAGLRNRSLDLATQDWIMWIDSDDLLECPGRPLESIIERFQNNKAIGFLFPYEYSYSHTGAVLCRHYRERLWPRGKCRFVNPVHEVAVPIEPNGITFQIAEDFVYKHQRQYISKPVESGRNLRILKDHVKFHPEDVRSKYYIGLEYTNNNLLDDGIKYLTEYIELSGWSDEKIMACSKLVEIFSAKADWKNGLKYAFKALEIDDWFECHFLICRMFYHLQDWKRCAYYGQLALERPKTETVLFINELDRFLIHEYLNVALNHLGRVKEAAESCRAGLKGLPDSPHLLHNLRLYDQLLAPKTGLDIVFCAGPSYEAWSPETASKTGLGGSETMLIQMAKRLSALGNRVRVYASPPAPGVFDGVEYFDLSEFKDLTCDVLIVSRYAPYLSADFRIISKVRLLWLHDVCAIQATNENLLRADKILCLSEWHKENVMKVHNLPSEQIIVTRNGIDIDQFCKKAVRNQYRIINSSSPDRSWDALIDIFKDVKKQVPEAELHLYYGAENLRKQNPKEAERLETMVNSTEGVFYHGRVSETELIEAFQSSQLWLYPVLQNFFETSCISAMQAKTAGCKIITSSHGALGETAAGDQTIFIEPGNKMRFVEETIKALTND